MMGDKAAAREAAAEAGVPVTPGSDGVCGSAAEVKRVGAEVGYPLVIKASAGGGGKGMRVVEGEAEVEDAYLGGEPGGGGQLRRRLGLRREVPGKVPARRGAGARRLLGQDGRLPREGLLHPAPLPEAHRGVPGPGSAARRSATGSWAASSPGRLSGLRGGRDGRVRLRGRRVLLYRDEHAAPGRAPRDGDGDGRGPRGASSSGSPPASALEVPDDGPRPRRARDRVPDQRRGPQAQLPAPGRTRRVLQPAGRPRRQGGLRTSTPATGCPRTTTRCWRSSSCTPATATRPSRRGLRALDEFAVSGLETTLPLHLAILEDEEFRRGGVTTSFLAERELRDEGGLLRLVAAGSPSA